MSFIPPRCEQCRTTPPEFVVEERRTQPTLDEAGIKAPWKSRYLCEPCTKTAALSDDPPRKITPLPTRKVPTAPPPNVEVLSLGSNWGRTE